MRIEFDARDYVLQKLPKRAVGAEIGVHKGAFSNRIIRTTNPKKLYLIDPYKYADDIGEGALYSGAKNTQPVLDERFQSVANRFSKQIENGTVIQIRDFSLRACAKIPDKELDFVYLDGDHSYEGVIADLNAYFPKLKSGGVIVGDDYQNLTSWWGDGVMRAFNEFIGNNAATVMIEYCMESQICLRKL